MNFSQSEVDLALEALWDNCIDGKMADFRGDDGGFEIAEKLLKNSFLSFLENK